MLFAADALADGEFSDRIGDVPLGALFGGIIGTVGGFLTGLVGAYVGAVVNPALGESFTARRDVRIAGFSAWLVALAPSLFVFGDSSTNLSVRVSSVLLMPLIAALVAGQFAAWIWRRTSNPRA